MKLADWKGIAVEVAVPVFGLGAVSLALLLIERQALNKNALSMATALGGIRTMLSIDPNATGDDVVARAVAKRETERIALRSQLITLARAVHSGELGEAPAPGAFPTDTPLGIVAAWSSFTLRDALL